MGIRNAMSMGRGANTKPVNTPAFTEIAPQDRGRKAGGSRISRVGSTARSTGSGSAGGGR